MEAEKEIEVSVVIPCLNESETLAACIEKAKSSLEQAGISHEIILADNGSVDGSQMVGRRLGARLVHVQDKGYGCTVMGGVEASKGRYVILAEADQRYDLGELHKFVEPLRAGHDLVQGCRLPIGGGTIYPGAMRRLYRRFAIPFFSRLARRWFQVEVKDLFCTLRAFSRQAYNRWALRCAGLEFATEMLIKASLYQDRLTEIPVSYLPGARRARRPHLRSIRAGWRTLRLLLISCPRQLFLAPGGIAILLGLLGYYLGYHNVQIGAVRFDVHTILLASLVIIMGYQTVLFAGFTMIFSFNERFLPPDPRVKWLCQRINMERGLMLGFIMFAAGMAFLLSAVMLWRANNFGGMDYQEAMRRVIPGVTLSVLGFQTVFSGAFMSILGMYRQPSQVQGPLSKRPSRPWLSVIMPTYQGGHHLDSALSSVAMQNDGGIEVIIVDDGSTDYARDVVEAWRGVLNMRVVWRDHVGNWVNNTNLGLREAQGEWVCLLHQDDLWNHGRIAELKDMIRRFPDVNFFFHPVHFINDKGWKVGRWKCPLPVLRKLDPSFVLPRLAVQDFIGIMAPMFRRSLVEQQGLMDEHLWYHADWDYWLRLVAAGPVAVHPESLASFRLHYGSQTAQRTGDLDDIRRQIEVVSARAMAHPAFPAKQRPATVRLAAFHLKLYLYLLGIVHRKTRATLELIAAALRLGPFLLLRYLYFSRLFDRIVPRLRFLLERPTP